MNSPHPLQAYITEQRRKKPILLMTHLVLGFPDFKTCAALIAQFIAAKVDLIELQIPFSEPTADGPLITEANHQALLGGITVDQCLDFAARMIEKYPQVKFVMMSYANVLFSRGFDKLMKESNQIGNQGWIVPDLPPEEAQDYLLAARKHQQATIFIYTPFHSAQRLTELAGFSQGMIYAVARKGVTGLNTTVNNTLTTRLQYYRQFTDLPLALGFGLSSAQDITAIKGQADIAVMGSKLLQLLHQKGLKAVGSFLRNLNPV